MPKTFHLPDLGEGLTEASIVSWHVAVGDVVAIDQPIVEVESAKAVVELPSPYAGTVATLHGEPGDVIELDGPLISIDTGDADAPADAPADAEPSGAPAPHVGDEFAAETAPTPDDSATHAGSGAVLVGYGTTEDTTRLKRPEGGRFGGRARGASARPSSPAPAERAAPATTADAPAAASAAPTLLDPTRSSPVVSPIVRRLAREHGFEAQHLAGDPADGLVRREHVERAIEAMRGGAAAAAPGSRPASVASPDGQTAPASAGAATTRAGAPGADDVTEIPLTGLRAVVADRLSRSRREVPEATIWLEVDVTETMALRRRLLDETGERFSMASLASRFALAGLARFPMLNATMSEDGRTIRQHRTVNLGVAAQTERGLVVPVIHGASGMSLRQLRDAITAIATDHADGIFPPAMLQGGTFTVNNYGGFGVDGSAPILNAPEVAMLGIGRIIDKPWVVDGEIVIRTIATLTFVFDHRVCDGDAASGFLTFVAGCLESPTRALVDL